MPRNFAVAAGAVLALVVSFASSSADAQIIYQPVRYQYGGQRPYYYGGNDPQVFAWADRFDGLTPQFGRVDGWSIVEGNVDTHREMAQGPQRNFTDTVPFQNAWVYGFTANDARNEAYLNVPRYFRKADLIAQATIDTDGTIVVPVQAGGDSRIDIRRYERSAAKIRAAMNRSAPVSSANTSQPIIIIPKGMLNQPLKKTPDKLVASAAQ